MVSELVSLMAAVGGAGCRGAGGVWVRGALSCCGTWTADRQNGTETSVKGEREANEDELFLFIRIVLTFKGHGDAPVISSFIISHLLIHLSTAQYLERT